MRSSTLPSVFLVLLLPVLALLPQPAVADPFVGTRTLTLYGDDNIQDGFQLVSEDANILVTTSGGQNYSMGFDNGAALTMTRDDGNLCLDPRPQPLGTGQAANAYMFSAGATGALLLMGQESSDPNAISIRVSTWTAGPVVLASQLAGAWKVTWVYNDNLRDNPGAPFSFQDETWLISDLGNGLLGVQWGDSNYYVGNINGNSLESNDAVYPSTKYLSIVTDGNAIAAAIIGVETYDPTDVGVRIGLATRIPEPATLALLAAGTLALIRRKRAAVGRSSTMRSLENPCHRSGGIGSNGLAQK